MAEEITGTIKDIGCDAPREEDFLEDETLPLAPKL